MMLNNKWNLLASIKSATAREKLDAAKRALENLAVTINERKVQIQQSKKEVETTQLLLQEKENERKVFKTLC